jgi:hypothetical protein
MLRNRLKDVEGTALSAIGAQKVLEQKIQKQESSPKKSVVLETESVDAKEVEELAVAFKAVKVQMATELEINAKTQKELETDLTSTKHYLLDVQHQLNMAEKV